MPLKLSGALLRNKLGSRRIKSVAVLLFGAGLLLFGIYGVSQWYGATQGKSTVDPVGVVTDEVDEPDETQPPKNYKVPADQPRQIILPSVRAAGFIQKVGRTKQNAIAVPANVHMAGWYVESPLPGKPGVSIIAGHLQGKFTDGVFRKLASVKQGDEIVVEYGDQSRRSFRVVQVSEVSAEQASQLQYEQVPDVTSQLTLVTCSGAFDRASQAYQQRIVVQARLQ